jgi:uncharacterized protein YcbK (DUF882 family)
MRAILAGLWCTAGALPGRAQAARVALPAGKAASLTATSPGAGGARKGAARPKPAPRNGPVELYAVNTHETLMLRLRDDKGRPMRGVQKRFDRFLRCHHTNVQHAMNPRLVRVLYQVGRHYPGRRVEVVSGYRHPSVAKNPHSPHMQGLACDFRVAGIKNADLRDFLRRDLQNVGVGYYPNSSFVHLDVRKDRSAFWIDYSGPGDRAMYSEAPGMDLQTGRADAYKPTRIDESWIHQPDVEPAPAGAEGGGARSNVGGQEEEGDDASLVVGGESSGAPPSAEHSGGVSEPSE